MKTLWGMEVTVLSSCSLDSDICSRYLMLELETELAEFYILHLDPTEF